MKFASLALALSVCPVFAVEIQSVRATDSDIVIQLVKNYDNTDFTIQVDEYDPYDLSTPRVSIERSNEANYSQTVTINRMDGDHDRIYSAFCARVLSGPAGSGSELELCSVAPQFVTQFDMTYDRYDRPFPRFCSKKGAQAVVEQDQELGVKAVAHGVDYARIFEAAYLAGSPPPGFSEADTMTVDGVLYYFGGPVLDEITNWVKITSKLGYLNYLVLLYYPPSWWNALQPNCDFPAQVCGFNTGDAGGASQFKMVTEFLVRWFSHFPSEGANYHGTIDGFIVGNEVDDHGTWYDIGDMTGEEVVSDYARTLRMAYTAVRKYRKNAHVYMSLTNKWSVSADPTHPLRAMPAKTLFDGIVDTVALRGDIEWGLAYHPYGLTAASPWSEWPDGFSMSSYSTSYIGPRNLHLIRDYMRESGNLFDGRQRPLAFTEQGFWTSTNPTLGEQQLQAAAVAYTYIKAAHLDGVEAFLYYRAIDNNTDITGLREMNGTKKLSWEVYHHADKIDWRKWLNPYLEIIQSNGRSDLTSWDAVLAEQGGTDQDYRVCGDGNIPAMTAPLLVH